jgi:hypothetical protein
MRSGPPLNLCLHSELLALILQIAYWFLKSRHFESRVKEVIGKVFGCINPICMTSNDGNPLVD